MSDTAVVLVNYHGSADTAKCIQSLLACKEPPALVVVDNTPNDPDLEKAISIYPGVHLIRPSENLGFGRGNNLGIKWALKKEYQYIFILNNDAIIEPRTIEKFETEMKGNRKCGILAARIVFLDTPEILWYGGGEIDWWRGGGRVPGVMGPAESDIAMQARNVSFASGCAMFVHRDVFYKIGGFDPRFFMYEEDLEFCLRALAHNYLIRYIPTAVVLHKCQGSLRSKDDQEFFNAWHPKNPNLEFYTYHITRNRIINMFLHARGKNAIRFTIGFPVLIALKLIRIIIHGRYRGAYAMIKGLFGPLLILNKKFTNELSLNDNGNEK